MYEQNSVEFMGVLVDRQYTTGQKYAQLVFETAEGIRLSLSRNISMVRALRLGLTYNVKGSERTVGQKRYIHEPTTTLVPTNKLSLISKRYKILIPVVASLIVVLGGVGALTYAANSSNTNSLPTVHKKTPTSKLVPATNISAPANSQPASDATSTQQQTPTVPIKSIKKSTSASPAGAATNPIISNPVTTPAANDAASLPITQNEAAPVIVQPVDETSGNAQEPPLNQNDPTSPDSPQE